MDFRLWCYGTGINSLNAAYTTIPSYLNTFDQSNRARTLGRITPLPLAHGTSPHRSKKVFSFMSSSPDLTSMASSGATRSQDLPGSKKNSSDPSNRMSSRAGNALFPVNGDEKSPRNSGGDYILQVQQENEALRREIDLKESKLQANMNSIKTFWSPELKKERSLRKEEALKHVTLREQLKLAQEENQHAQLTMQALQDELKAQRDLNQLLQDDFTSSHRSAGSGTYSSLTHSKGDLRIVEESNERLIRENELLQQTMEEMEARIEAQQQTLDTRDESVRKLLEMLQSKGSSRTEMMDIGLTVELDAMRVQLADYEGRLSHMDTLVLEKNKEIDSYKQKLQSHAAGFEDVTRVKALQSLLDVKETKIASLERILHDLEDELAAHRHDEVLSSAERKEEVKQIEAYRSHSNYMKTKIDELQSDLLKKETELLSLHTRLDTFNNQRSDDRQHIDLLKESLAAKEKSSAILQSEVESLRGRLDEKQQILDQKQDQIDRCQEEKSGIDSELLHMHDTMDVKDRKITVLLKKIESLKEGVVEREKEVQAMDGRLRSLQHDSSAFDCNMSTMEEALEKKNEELKCVKAEKENVEERLQNEIDQLKKTKRSLEKKLNTAEAELNDREASLSEVKEKAISLVSSGMQKDSKISQFEITLQQESEKVLQLESQLKKTVEEAEIAQARSSNALSLVMEENKEKTEELTKVAKEKADEAEKCQKDLDRLLEILKETENEKHAKDKKIYALDKDKKELQVKIKSLKTQMSEEMKKKGAAQDKDVANYQDQIRKSKDRVEELEAALRESLNITAEREEVLSREEEKRHKVEKQMEELLGKFEQTKSVLAETGKRLASSDATVHEMDRRIQQLKREKRKQLEEALEIKQEALLAAISKKDADIALLELSQSSKKANADKISRLRLEKDRLVHQLKQETQNRLKLLHETNDGDSSSKPGEKRFDNGSSRPQPRNPDDDGEGIWA